MQSPYLVKARQEYQYGGRIGRIRFVLEAEPFQNAKDQIIGNGTLI
jgi:hypothetical protein